MPEKDTDLTRLFVRDLDDIVLPARERWRPAPRKGSALMKATRFALAATAVVAVLVLALIASFGLRDDNPVAAPQTASPSASATTTSSPQPSASSSPARATSLPNVDRQTGTITGRLGYPSEFVPPLTVYAISVSDSNVWYSTNTPYFGNFTRPSPTPTPSFVATWPPGEREGVYQLNVPAGTYYVVGYSNDPDLPKDLPVAYTEHTMRCMSSDPARPSPPPGPCPYPRTLVPVTVTVGQTVRYIDLVDWGFQGVTFPPRPTPR